MHQKAPIFPPALKHGDRIRVVCTARAVVLEEILSAVEWIRTQGFRVEYGSTIGKVSGQFGGTDEERISDIQDAINDKGVRAIWCARGGYGTARLLDQLDLNPLVKDPKWIIGYSDITALHAALFTMNLVSLHAPMPLSFNSTQDTSIAFGLLLSYLMGTFVQLEWKKSEFDTKGITRGRLTGGNLSVLYSLRGTKYDVNTSNAILYFEDVDEYLYHIDRMCNNFSLGKVFASLSGLLVGKFVKMNDNAIPFGQSANEIIAHYSDNKGIPVRSFDAPFGHDDYNLPLLNGAQAILEVGDENVTLKYDGRT